VFELKAQTKLGFIQVFHLKFCLEVSHRFLNVPGRTDDVQIIDIDGDDAKPSLDFFMKTQGQSSLLM
jgi:hypothetical protein